MCTKIWRQENKKHNSNLNRFFSIFFYFHFLVESHYLDPSLFKQTFFCKRKLSLFFIIFNTVFFFNISFQTCQFFFANFQSPKNFFFIQNKTPSYFEKETEWETIYFFCIFLEIENIFFLFWQESNFMNLNKTIKFINTKTRSFFLFFLQKKNDTRVSTLLLTYKRNVRTEVSLHVS